MGPASLPLDFTSNGEIPELKRATCPENPRALKSRGPEHRGRVINEPMRHEEEEYWVDKKVGPLPPVLRVCHVLMPNL